MITVQLCAGDYEIIVEGYQSNTGLFRLGVTAQAPIAPAITVLSNSGASCADASDGVVSEAVAIAMAVGIKKRFATDLGISVTGAAGPNPHGGAAVGTVWVGIAAAEESRAKRFFFKGTRSEIQMAAAEAALGLIWIHFGELEV
jgi:hypothetical protein